MKASFRDYINTLRRNDEMLEITKPVDLRDVAALVAQSEKALLFKNLIGYSMPVVSGLLQSRNRIALGMGVEYGRIADKLGKAMDKPIKPKRIANAPVKEVIHTGKKVNLYDLPVPVFSIMDGGPMITGGVVIAEDPEFGINAGIYRLMLKERNITGIDIVTPNNMRKFAERALAKKKPLPISISIGTHPYELVASTFKANLGVNELTFAGGLRNEPLRLADGETVPVPCIADAEIVLEGEILPEGWVHPEGPFCEFNRLMALLSIADIKHVTIVDDDIDVFDPVDVEWAVATRVQADRDVLIVPNARAKPLDPSLPLPLHGKVPTTAKMGIDATIPENIPAERYTRIVYFNQGKIDLKNYLGPVDEAKKPSTPSKPAETVEVLAEKIVALIEKSHCFFADLLEKFPRVDYKTVASAVARLYEEGKINQDKDGKFELK